MTARKKPTPPPPVTIRDLLLAVASYPQDAVVDLDHSAVITVALGEQPEGVDEFAVLWEPLEAPQHYQRADVVERVIRRSDPLDDFAAAQEFLEWLRERGYQPPRQSTGGGHNEPTSYRDLEPTELAQEFATRSTT